MTVSKYILEFLISKNVKHVFLITGGAISFVVDAFSRNKKIKYICVAHEQAAAMMADAYEINYSEIRNNKQIDKVLNKILNSKKPEFVNIIIDPNQKIIPKIQFGKPIEDLSPLLSRSEFKKNMIIPELKDKSLDFNEIN